MLRRDILEKIERKLESDLDKVLSKNELSAADWDAVKKAMCIANMANAYANGEMVDEEGMSYGYANHYGYPGYSQESMSNGRMRSPVTGRYVSNGMMNGMTTRSSYGDGNSGHSIEDRMIMALEQQMDAAKTDYERSMIEKEIRRIRRGDM